jgi:DNA-binding transcriptional LysR family regulator
MDDPELGDLRLFVRIVELGSLAAAARERGWPPSQVSRALKRLERAVGLPLLSRSTHALALTAEGETLLDHARRVLGAWAEADDALGAARGQVGGWVRVGLSAAMAHFVIAPSLPGLAERHPALRIDLHVSDRIVDMAREGIDLTIRTGDPQGDELIARRIGTHGRRLYAAPAYLARHGRPRRPADLAQHRLITISAQPALNRWAFVVDGQPQLHVAQGAWSVDSTAMAIRLALLGLGILRINTAIAEPLAAAGALERLLDDAIVDAPVPIYAVYPRERRASPKVRACVDYWAQWFAAQPRLGAAAAGG